MIPDAAVRRVFKLIRGGAHLRPGPKVLTVRERQILAQFAKGKSYARIAEALGVSMTTVRNAVYRVQDKLGVQSSRRSWSGPCETACWMTTSLAMTLSRRRRAMTSDS